MKWGMVKVSLPQLVVQEMAVIRTRATCQPVAIITSFGDSTEASLEKLAFWPLCPLKLPGLETVTACCLVVVVVVFVFFWVFFLHIYLSLASFCLWLLLFLCCFCVFFWSVLICFIMLVHIVVLLCIDFVIVCYISTPHVGV